MRGYVCALIIAALLFLSGVVRAASTAQVRFNNVSVRAEVVSSDRERAAGLMFRETLDAGEGMLFVFDRQLRYSFWMKNMKFPLDLIWISRDKTVVDITRAAQPCVNACESLSPIQPAKYVLEVNAGFAAAHNIQIGDRIDF